MSNPFVIVDIETTGLKRDYHGITEIAAVRFDGNKIIEEWQTLVNPRMPISSMITRLTGIDDKMVKDKPPIQEVLPGFLEFLGGDIFVAHNASFDRGFLEHNAGFYLGYEWTNEVLCTRKLANRVLPNLKSKSLSSLCKHFGIVNVQAHRAMADVKATVEVLREMIGLFEMHHTGSTPEHLFEVHDRSVGYGKSIFGRV